MIEVNMFPLEPWQRDLFTIYQNNNKDKWIVIKAHRQLGKSICMEGLLISASLEQDNSFSLFVSPVIQQARKVYQDVCNIASELIKSANGSVLEITFINGSVIKFGSSQQADSLRGFTVKKSGILIIDEAAFCSDDVFYQILVPTTNVYHSDIFIVSTPKFKRGFFYELWLKGLDTTQDKVISVDWNNYDTSKYLPTETLELYRQQMPKLAFKSEFLAEFIDGEGTVFTDFKRCIQDLPFIDNQPTYIGIDWGGNTGNDNTAITVGQVINNKPRITHLFAFNDKNANETIDYIVELIKSLHTQDIYVEVEKNSIGNIFFQLLYEKIPENVTLMTFNTTNKSKDRIIKQLINCFEKNIITIPNNQSLINELSMYQCVINNNGLPIYNAPSGMRDDRVMSLCFCLDAMYVDLV